MTPIQRAFLDQYLDALTEQERNAIPRCTATYFCADEYNANECARLINSNIKRAACSLKSAFDHDQDPLPAVGELTLVLDWDQQPVCVIKLTATSICPFDEVTREFAELEGEGDGTYEWWRTAHIKFFSTYAQTIGTTFNEKTELVLERFEKVYPR